MTRLAASRDLANSDGYRERSRTIGWLRVRSCSEVLLSPMLAPHQNEEPFPPVSARCSVSTTGSGVTFKPGFSLSVPSRKSAFLGLMQNSSTLILLVVLTPWRRRKPRTLSGASSLVVKNESQNS